MAKKKKGGESGFPWTIVAVTALTFIAGIVFMVYFGDKLVPSSSPPSPPGAKAPVVKKLDIKLYFGNDMGKVLVAEKGEVRGGTLEEKLTAAMEALISGPDDTSLTDVMPVGTKLLSVEVRDGTAYVNLSAGAADDHSGGSSGEILTVFSIVNTLTLNFDEVDSVQLLIEGEKRDTLAGHILIKVPLTPDRKYIKG